MNFPQSRAFLVSLSFLAVSLLQHQASGNHGVVETVYSSPLETVLAVPTTYLAPTAYVTPTAYVAPTSYVLPTTYLSTTSYVYPTAYVTPTAYVASTSYIPTTYALPAEYTLAPSAYVVPTYYPRRRLFAPRRTVYESTSYYVPTAAYYPTTTYTPTALVYPTTAYRPTVLVDDAVVTTSATSMACCNPQPVCCETAPARPAPAASAAPRASAEPPPSEVSSVPANESTSSYRTEQGGAGVKGGNRPAGEPAESGTPPTPTAPAPEPPGAVIPRADETPAVAPAPAVVPQGEGVTSPPVAPGGEVETLKREAKRPVLSNPYPQANRPHILEGKVVSIENRGGEEGVRVTVSSRTGVFEDRAATTDALGHYAIRLPDGDWTVKVAGSSGRLYTVSKITISGGQITDSLGRNVPTLTITR